MWNSWHKNTSVFNNSNLANASFWSIRLFYKLIFFVLQNDGNTLQLIQNVIIHKWEFLSSFKFIISWFLIIKPPTSSNHKTLGACNTAHQRNQQELFHAHHQRWGFGHRSLLRAHFVSFRTLSSSTNKSLLQIRDDKLISHRGPNSIHVACQGP